MANHPSPGIFTKIYDLSTYLESVPGSIGYIPFLSRKGPDNQLIFNSTLKDFVENNGLPNINEYGRAFSQGKYIAYNHMTVSPSLYSIRVLPDDATYSNLIVVFNSDSTGSIEVSHASSQNTVAELESTLSLNSSNVNPLLLVYPTGRGDYYDDYAITIERHPNQYLNSSVDGVPATPVEAIYLFNIWKTQNDGSDVKIESYEVCFDEESQDSFGDSMFIEDVINRFSSTIKVMVNKESLNTWKSNGATTVEVGNSITPVHLYLGSEGSLVTVDAITGKRTVDSTVATNLLANAYLGLITNPISGEYEDKVTDTENYYFPIVWDGGYSSNVKASAVTLVNDIRRDGVALLDNGDNLTVSSSIVSRDTDNNYNTYFAALFEPYTKVYDVHTGKDIWVSPIYHMSTLIPLNDALYSIWYPSAGPKRGLVSKIKELRFSPKLEQRDQLYLKQINPIVRFGIGDTVFGQLTTQKRASKLQDLSIVRMVLYIKRSLEQFYFNYIFDFNDKDSWDQLRLQTTAFLETIRVARGLEAFTVEIAATEYEKKRKKAHANVTLTPTGILEQIELNLFIK